MIGIEVPACFESVTVVRKVVLLLGMVGHENLVPVGQRDFVVYVFVCGFAGSYDNLVGFLLIARLEITQRGHLHVRAHVHVAAFHGLHSMSAAVVAHPRHVAHLGRAHVGHVALGLLLPPKRRKCEHC
ncbi:MAG: hypothetical protein ABSG51_18160 [Terracidiphilus sp.]